LLLLPLPLLGLQAGRQQVCTNVNAHACEEMDLGLTEGIARAGL
jgi:hypothetical protein